METESRPEPDECRTKTAWNVNDKSDLKGPHHHKKPKFVVNNLPGIFPQLLLLTARRVEVKRQATGCNWKGQPVNQGQRGRSTSNDLQSLVIRQQSLSWPVLTWNLESSRSETETRPSKDTVNSREDKKNFIKWLHVWSQERQNNCQRRRTIRYSKRGDWPHTYVLQHRLLWRQ